MGTYAEMCSRSIATIFSVVAYLLSPVTCRGQSFQRKRTRQSRSSIGWLSVPSNGVTSAARMMRALPPSTTRWGKSTDDLHLHRSAARTHEPRKDQACVPSADRTDRSAPTLLKIFE